MPRAVEGREIDVGLAAYVDAVEVQIAGHADLAFALLEVPAGQVRVLFVEPEPELGAASGLGELHVDVLAVDGGLELLERIVAAGGRDDFPFSFGQFVRKLTHDDLLLGRSSWSRFQLRSRPAQARWLGPDFQAG